MLMKMAMILLLKIRLWLVIRNGGLDCTIGLILGP